MVSVENQTTELQHLKELEDKLSQTLRETEKQISHSDCFDDEQRSEIYSIVRAFKHECQANTQIIGQWINDLTGESSNV